MWHLLTNIYYEYIFCNMLVYCTGQGASPIHTPSLLHRFKPESQWHIIQSLPPLYDICNCNNAHNLFKGSARLLLGLHIKYQIHLCITYYFGSAQQIWCLTLELMLTVFQTLTFLLILSNIWLWQKIVRFWYSQIGCKYQITLMSYHVYKICRLLLTSYGLCQFQYRLCTC